MTVTKETVVYVPCLGLGTIDITLADSRLHTYTQFIMCNDHLSALLYTPGCKQVQIVLLLFFSHLNSNLIYHSLLLRVANKSIAFYQ